MVFLTLDEQLPVSDFACTQTVPGLSCFVSYRDVKKSNILKEKVIPFAEALHILVSAEKI